MAYSLAPTVLSLLLLTAGSSFPTTHGTTLPHLAIHENAANCSSTTACKDNLRCIAETSEDCAAGDTECLCIPIISSAVSCTNNTGCTDEDAFCGIATKKPFIAGLCFTCEKYENLTDTFKETFDMGNNCGSEVCIAAHHLAHVAAHHLIYAAPRRASVLCDAQRNCATPGHIVVYHQKPMMMSTYCRQIGTCTRRTSLVNSPKMGVKSVKRIKSHSEHLEFTAMAARYETKAEEGALSLLVRAGL